MREHDPLRAELDRLSRSGAAVFDPVGLRFVRALIERADRHGGGAAERLRARASGHLAHIAQALGQASRGSAATVRALAERGFDTRTAEATIERGDLVAVRRAARRYRHRAQRAAGSSRRIELSPTARPGAQRRRRTANRPPPAAPVEAYRAPLAALVTELSLARTRRTLPAEPGPYNGRVVAARLLETLATLSPRYAHAQLERMHELAALSLLPEPVPRKRNAKR